MKLTNFLVAEMDREADRSRRVLKQVPEGHFEWKPHERSMSFGYLAQLVATIPSWIALQLEQSELDVAPAGGSTMNHEAKKTSAALLQALDTSMASAHSAFAHTTEEDLATAWQLKARGQVVQEAPRFDMIQDTLNHWAHHRGQMTVYLRLLGATVPATFGPSADEKNFG